MGILNIDLLNSSFTIEAKEDDNYLQGLLEYYTRVVKEVRLMSPNTDEKKVAILTGIMICDELFKDRIKADELKKVLDSSDEIEYSKKSELHEAEKITLKMIQDLDRFV